MEHAEISSFVKHDILSTCLFLVCHKLVVTPSLNLRTLMLYHSPGIFWNLKQKFVPTLKRRNLRANSFQEKEGFPQMHAVSFFMGKIGS